MTYETGRLSWFDPEAATERRIADLRIRFTRSGSPRIPHLDVTGDVNGDGLDDLVIPDLDGFWISTQNRDGSFSGLQQMGPAEPYLHEPGLTSAGIDQSRSYGDVGISEFTLPLYRDRLHAADIDQDGRRDLLFWNTDRFDVYRQDTSGSFSPVSHAISADVPIDSEGIYSRTFDFSHDGVLSFLFGFNEKSRRTVLYALRDLNGDGVADLVTLTLAGRSLARQSSRYRVHFGAASTNGVTFDRDNSVELKPRGRATGMQPWGYASQSFRDFDADGDVDIMLRHVKIGFGGMGRALVGRSVALDLEFFRMTDGGYPAHPDATRKIRPRLDLLGKAVFLPPVMLGDIDGDRRADLLVGKSSDELDIYRGVPGAGVFTRHPQTVGVSLPNDERNSWLAHLNRDGKKDLVVYHPSDTGPHRLITLIAR